MKYKKSEVVVVTGGSRGIGLATAKILSENGAIVAITAKDKDRLENAVKEIPNAIGIAANIRNSKDVKNVISKIYIKNNLYNMLKTIIKKKAVFVLGLILLVE